MKRFVFCVCVLSAVLFPTAAESTGGFRTKWSFQAGLDASIVPDFAYESGGTHFSSEIEGASPSFVPEAAATYSLLYFGEEAAPRLSCSFTTLLTMVQVREVLGISVRPFPALPFLSIQAGGHIAACFFAEKGIYDAEKGEYEQGGIEQMQYRSYARLAADIPLKSWTFGAGAEVAYIGLIGAGASDLWVFLGEGNAHQFNGFTYGASLFAFYRANVPILESAGITALAEGYFSDSRLDEHYSGFDGTFTAYTVMPVLNLALTKKDSVSLMLPFKNRRSFTSAHDNWEKEPLLQTSGSEWLLSGIKLHYTHRF